MSKPRRTAFTLVELLVVIGIIALLVALLLPALQAARRQAQTVKCATALREIGNAFVMYAHDNKGYYPPASWQGGTGGPLYNIDGADYSSAIWHSFIAKYVTKTKLGISSTTADEAADSRKSVIWGCPLWIGWASGAIGGFDRTLSGYGMNPYPTLNATSPTQVGAAATLEQPATNERNLIRFTGAGTVQNGIWVKAVKYTRPADRGLVADAWNWRVKVRPKPANNDWPGQPAWDAINTFTSDAGTDRNQTLVDVFRHGAFPKRVPGVRRYEATGGKVGFNVLFCDGHVITYKDQEGGYDPFRMGNPGGIR